MSLTSEELNYLIYRYLQESGRELTALCLQEETRVLEFDEKFKQHIPFGCLVSLVQKGILYTEAELMVDYDGKVKTNAENIQKYQYHFTLAQALQIQGKKCREVKQQGRFALADDSEGEENEKNMENLSRRIKEEKEETAHTSQEGNDVDRSVNADASTDALSHDNSQTQHGFSASENIKEHDLTNSDKKSKVLKLEPCFSYEPSTFCEFSSASLFAYAEKNSVLGVTKIVRNFKEVETGKPDEVVLQHNTLSDQTSFSLAEKMIGKSQPTLSTITCLSWTAVGDRIMTGTQSGELRIWTLDGTLNNVLALHKSAIITIKWNSNGVFCLTMDANNVVVVWNTFSGMPVQHFDLKEILNSYHHSEDKDESLGIDCCWIEADKFVIPGLNGAILLFDLNSAETTTANQPMVPVGRLLGHTRTITCLDYDTESKMLLSSSDDCTVRIWRGTNSNFKNLFKGHTQPIVNASWFNSSKCVISSSLDGTVKLWSSLPEFGNKEIAISISDGVPIIYGSMSNNKTLYAIGRVDGTVIVYDLAEVSQRFNILVDESFSVDASQTADQLQQLELPIKAQYSTSSTGASEENHVYITSMSWSADDSMIGVSCDRGSSFVLRLEALSQ
ncbi:hypothetical protein ACO0QE_003296 [Hanseniaspora vineae]